MIVAPLFLLLFVGRVSGVDDYMLPGNHGLRVCNNQLVRDIRGGPQSVFAAGLQYLESMKNNSLRPVGDFKGAWKWELYRVIGPLAPKCESMFIFGNERKNYDEAKRFCFLLDGKPNSPKSLKTGQPICSVYSVGSNDKWHFEELMHEVTNCTIETFDCTIQATIPTPIRDRTRYHKNCMSPVYHQSKDGWVYNTYAQMNMLTNVTRGPDYLKIDAEGYEWSILRSMIKKHIHQQLKRSKKALHSHSSTEGDESGSGAYQHLPLQIYLEMHLDRDVNPTIDGNWQPHSVSRSDSHVGMKLRAIFDDLFLKAGYMIMFVRTTLQTRNTDILLTKMFCDEYNE